ncbi:class I mannose-6-phosphate isomerase [Clostridium sp. AN503]|uniref:class I mannose-6-phosphate isomerase n=1 Tax=Clostridium sp. AN503 TaxID=3160598 RepID=UPI003457A156
MANQEGGAGQMKEAVNGTLNCTMSGPVKVYPERVWRTYLGGKLLDGRLGKTEAGDGHYPEEWILSSVAAVGPDGAEEGICKADWGGEKMPFTALCPNMGVLTKVIDSAERLTIQVHPDRDRAMRYFHSAYGKTECWHILGKRQKDGCIYLGFRPGITRMIWEECFWRQDIERMLGCLHRIPVKPGETYLIPGGMPHAIGAGCLLLEIQEPTDYTLRTECVTPSGERIDEKLIHQGIGIENMFECFDYNGLTEKELMERCRISRRQTERAGISWVCLAGKPQVSCFSLLYIEVLGNCTMRGEKSAYGLYVWEGRGKLISKSEEYLMEPGSQFLIPPGCDVFSLVSEKTVRLFRVEGPE